jgi:signal recognition particle GTPase
MPLRISFDDTLNALANMKQEDFTRLAEQYPSILDWVERFDLATHVERLHRVRDAMTPGERNDPTVIDSDRLAQIAAESGWDPEELQRLIDGFQTLSRTWDSMNSLAV